MFSSTEDTDVLPVPRAPAPADQRRKGRALIAAMAAGRPPQPPTPPSSPPLSRPLAPSWRRRYSPAGSPLTRGPEVVAVKPAALAAVHAGEQARGVA